MSGHVVARAARRLRQMAFDGRAGVEWWLCRRAWNPRAIENPRFPGRPLLKYRTPIGTYLLPAQSYDGWVERVMRRGQIFEPEIVEIAREYAQPGTIVIDAGANFGQMALLFANMVGDDGRVVALEADHYVFWVLEQNLLANGAKNVTAHHRAVFDRSGETMFLDEKDFQKFASYGSFGLNPEATNGDSVETLAVDDLNLDEPVSFMKVDVQGSDLSALRGARNTIMRHQMPIIFEYEEQFQSKFGTTFQDYMDFVDEIGYRVARTAMGINYLIVPR